MTDPLSVLLSGARFDRKEQQQQQAAAASAAASPAAGSSRKAQKRKRQQEKQAAGAAAGCSQDGADGQEADGIALFGGSNGAAPVAAAAAEQLPVAQHSNDAHEAANLLRKALRIKVCLCV